MYRKLVVFMMLTVLILSSLLSGCGSTGGTEEKETVKIAYIGPITGPSAAMGLGLRNSVELAVNQANESGELPVNLEFLALDDAGDPATAVNAANKAASDPDVIAVVAHFNSGCALATKDVFHKYGLPAIIAAAINDKITQDGYEEITRVITTSRLQNEYAGEVAANQFGIKKVAVIHDQTDYGKTNAEQFMNKAKEYGVEVLSFDGISVGQQDFSALLTKIKSEQPEMIFFGGLATEAALIKRQMEEIKIPALFMSDSGIHSKTFLEIAGELGEGTLCHGLIRPIDQLPKGQEFIKAYEAAGFKEYYESYGPLAYDAAGIIVDALKRTEAMDRSSVAKAIRETKDFDGVLGKTSFDEEGQSTVNSVVTYVVQDGEWVTLETSKYTVQDGKLVSKSN